MSAPATAAAFGVLAALCAMVLRRYEPALGLVVALAAAVMLLAWAGDALEEILAFLDELEELSGISPAVVGPVLKAVGIAVLTRISSDLCRDAGEGGVASAVELAGSAAALFAALPLLRAALTTLTELL